MSKEIDRRDFIGIIFGTVSAAALAGPSSDLWPTKAKERLVTDPIIFHLNDGYIIDPDFDYKANWPTIRENRYDGLSTEDQVSFLLEWLDDDEDLKDFEKSFGKPCDEWGKKELPALEDALEGLLDADEDPDYFSSLASAKHSEYSAGIEVLESLGDEEAKELGLYLVEGPHPGSSFCGVAFDGDLSELNQALAREGLNLKITNET